METFVPNYESRVAEDGVHEYLNWSQTQQGAQIPCFSSYPLENTAKSNPIFLMGGVHGDEPEGVRLAEETLQWLRTTDSRQDLAEWVLIPCINPDGYAKKERTNANGVDLNRNYPTPNWTSDAKKPRYNPGPSAGSEIEIQSLVHLFDKIGPRLLIHCHSWQPCVIYKGDSGRAAAEALGQASGYSVSNDIGYPTPGSLGSYGDQVLDTPVICIEAEEGADLDSVWPQFRAGLEAIFLQKVGPN